MSDNPFKEPPPQHSAGGQYAAPTSDVPQSFPPVAPGALTPILVFCLLLGILGLVGNCFGGGMLLAMPMLAELTDSAPLPEEQKVFNRLVFGAQKSVVLPQLILIGINFIVATMLIIGSIGCLKRKESSRSFLRLGLIGAIFYSILKLMSTAWVFYVSDGALREGVEGFAGDPIYEDLKTQLATQAISTIVTIVVMVLFAIAFLIFYTWARNYLGKKVVEDHFAAISEYRSRS